MLKSAKAIHRPFCSTVRGFFCDPGTRDEHSCSILVFQSFFEGPKRIVLHCRLLNRLKIMVLSILQCDTAIWMFSKIVGFSSKIIHVNGVFHYKPSILGYHYFWKPQYNAHELEISFLNHSVK